MASQNDGGGLNHCGDYHDLKLNSYNSSINIKKKQNSFGY